MCSSSLSQQAIQANQFPWAPLLETVSFPEVTVGTSAFSSVGCWNMRSGVEGDYFKLFLLFDSSAVVFCCSSWSSMRSSDHILSPVHSCDLLPSPAFSEWENSNISSPVIILPASSIWQLNKLKGHFNEYFDYLNFLSSLLVFSQQLYSPATQQHEYKTVLNVFFFSKTLLCTMYRRKEDRWGNSFLYLEFPNV